MIYNRFIDAVLEKKTYFLFVCMFIYTPTFLLLQLLPVSSPLTDLLPALLSLLFIFCLFLSYFPSFFLSFFLSLFLFFFFIYLFIYFLFLVLFLVLFWFCFVEGTALCHLAGARCVLLPDEMMISAAGRRENDGQSQ